MVGEDIYAIQAQLDTCEQKIKQITTDEIQKELATLEQNEKEHDECLEQLELELLNAQN